MNIKAHKHSERFVPAEAHLYNQFDARIKSAEYSNDIYTY